MGTGSRKYISKFREMVQTQLKFHHFNSLVLLSVSYEVRNLFSTFNLLLFEIIFFRRYIFKQSHTSLQYRDGVNNLQYLGTKIFFTCYSISSGEFLLYFQKTVVSPWPCMRGWPSGRWAEVHQFALFVIWVGWEISFYLSFGNTSIHRDVSQIVRKTCRSAW